MNPFNRLVFKQSSSTRLTYKSTLQVHIQSISKYHTGSFLKLTNPKNVPGGVKLKGKVIAGPKEFKNKHATFIVVYGRVKDVEKNAVVEMDLSLHNKIMDVRPL